MGRVGGFGVTRLGVDGVYHGLVIDHGLVAQRGGDCGRGGAETAAEPGDGGVPVEKRGCATGRLGDFRK